MAPYRVPRPEPLDIPAHREVPAAYRAHLTLPPYCDIPESARVIWAAGFLSASRWQVTRGVHGRRQILVVRSGRDPHVREGFEAVIAILGCGSVGKFDGDRLALRVSYLAERERFVGQLWPWLPDGVREVLADGQVDPRATTEEVVDAWSTKAPEPLLRGRDWGWRSRR